MLQRVWAQHPPPVRSLTTDLLSGTVVGVILVPTSMAYGIVAGVGATSGLYGAIALGLVAAMTGGTRALISGPNVFVAVVMTPVVGAYGLQGAFTAALLAGAILVAFGLLRLGRFIAYIPHSLLSGFFTAAGLLLIATQILPMLGLPTAPGGVVGNAKEWFGATVNYEALAVAAITIVVGLVWPRRLAKYAPSQFVALVVGTATGVAWLSGAPVIGDIPSGLPDLHLPVSELAIIGPAFTMALLSAATTLITAVQLDSITGEIHKPNRELVAQGLGNVAAGLIGGNPGGVSSTSLINAHAGGRSRIAALAAVSVLVLSTIALQAIRVPLAALAGIIMVTGYRIIDWPFLRRIRRIPFGYSLLMLATVCLAVLVDFVTAILIGLVIAALVNAARSERYELDRLKSVPLLDTELWPDAEPYSSRVGLIVLPDTISIASARRIATILRGDVQASELVILHFGDVEYIDDSAAAVIGRVVAEKHVIVAGLHGDAATLLTAFAAVSENQAKDLEQAKDMAREMLDPRH